MSALTAKEHSYAPVANGALEPAFSSVAGAEQRLWPQGVLMPGPLVRWAFYLSAFSIPFMRVYVPGTGERFGVARMLQVLLLCAVAAQPRVCLRFVPVALLWLAGYQVYRGGMGLWLAPEWANTWWPNILEWFQSALPRVWIMFNVLQFSHLRRGGLWALIWGCALCSVLHIAGVGVSEVDNSVSEVRTTVFGENANLVGATYATALIILIGLGMFKEAAVRERLLQFGLIGLIGIGLAKTGSRTAILMVAMGCLVLLFRAEAFSSRARRYASLAAIAAVLVGVVCQVPTVMKRFEKISGANLRQQEGRVRMAPVLVEIFLRSPICGSGPDIYQPELTRRAMPHLIREQRTISAHNLVLLLLAETGVIGFLLYFAALSQALRSAWRARRTAAGLLPLALLTPFLITCIVLGNPTTHSTFWFVFAYALAQAA